MSADDHPKNPPAGEPAAHWPWWLSPGAEACVCCEAPVHAEALAYCTGCDQPVCSICCVTTECAGAAICPLCATEETRAKQERR